MASTLAITSKISALFRKNHNKEWDYPGLSAKPADMVRFIDTGATFIILLTDGQIIHFKPKELSGFRSWLLSHKVRNLTGREKPAHYKYFGQILAKRIQG